ncbi:MAG: thioredoxin 1 [Colwellia sp.]|jgi:thioredoxin 1|tara:strand:- start:1069 stop:1455 length:387 start_codon:yes stop_codon:yes gene_type:complete
MLTNLLTTIILIIESDMKDKANFQGLKALEHKQPWVLLYFSTSWCAPCKDMALIMDDVSIQYVDQLKMVNIDVDNDIQLAKECGVKGVPTLVLLDKSNNKSSLIGGVSGAQVKDWLDTKLSATSKKSN